MVSKFISVGNKVELTRVQSAQKDNNIVRRKVYVSQVFDIVDETKLKVAMPIENGHVVVLAPYTRLDACFYTAKGLYHGRVVVVERMKERNMYVMIVELQYELKKFQRRQYYRLSCTMDLQYRIMNDEEKESFISSGETIEETDIKNFVTGVALDFSGGGIRFISKERYAKEDLMYVRLMINYDNVCKVYQLVGRVIASVESKNSSVRFENRVEFVNVDSKVREAIIQHIFREERRQRKVDSGRS